MRRILAIIVPASLVVGVSLSSTSFGGREELKQLVDGERPKTYQGLSVSLTIAGPECQVDEPINVTVRFAASGDSHRLFNPFFNGLLEQPGRLLVRNDRGKIVNRLLEFHGGSRRAANKGDYVNLIDGGFVGREFSVYPSRKRGGIGASLPPGDYTMQLVLHGLLLSLSGEDATKEIVTSERVPFRIVK